VIFENRTDRSNQDTLQWILESIGFRVEQTSTLCSYDFRIYYNNRLHAIAEYKARDKLWDPLFVDRQKIRQLVSAAKSLKAKPIFVTGCPGPPYYFIHPHTDYQERAFTRTKDGGQRGETQDIVYQIPKSEFILL
jgi:Holliday junction resolvase